VPRGSTTYRSTYNSSSGVHCERTSRRSLEPPPGIHSTTRRPSTSIMRPDPRSLLPLLLLGCGLAPAAAWRSAVVQPQGCQRSGRAGHPVLQQQPRAPPVSASPFSGAGVAVAPASAPASGEWQLDFYSRPVQGADGKKLWELLVTDSSGAKDSRRPRGAVLAAHIEAPHRTAAVLRPSGAALFNLPSIPYCASRALHSQRRLVPADFSRLPRYNPRSVLSPLTPIPPTNPRPQRFLPSLPSVPPLWVSRFPLAHTPCPTDCCRPAFPATAHALSSPLTLYPPTDPQATAFPIQPAFCSPRCVSRFSLAHTLPHRLLPASLPRYRPRSLIPAHLHPPTPTPGHAATLPSLSFFPRFASRELHSRKHQLPRHQVSTSR
jgi:hypothetical protein